MSTYQRTTRGASSPGFTIVELLVVIAIIGVLVSLLLPAMRFSGDAARRMQCSNNLKQTGLALHNYHDTHGHFPAAMGGTGRGATPAHGNANRLSGLVAVLPFLEQQPLWDQISAPIELDGVLYPAMGPAPWVAEYAPWQRELATFRCPSADAKRVDFGQTNYAFCVGDATQQIHRPTRLRGAFACRMTSSFDDFTDGTSNTIAMGETGTVSGLSVIGRVAAEQPASILTNPSLCLGLADRSGDSYDKAVSLREPGRGGRWADGAAEFSLFNTVLPPNSPGCAVGGTRAADGLYSAGSTHPGGSQVVLADGSIRFIAEVIDAGDPTHPPVTQQANAGSIASPYGVWGALGTLAGEEDPGQEW